MKLFKNKVGRPSNETKSMRRIFVVSIAAIIISLITLAVSLLCKSNVLTENLKGEAAYSVSYGLWDKNNNDIRIQSYPSYNKHNGTIYFPGTPHYTVTSGKKCSFKGWIFQKLDDNRYRVRTTSGQYVWYRPNLDSDKYKMERYAFFGGPTGTKSYRLGYSIPVKLYAAFDCGTDNNSSGTGNTTSTPVSNDKIRIVYDKNAKAATGTMASKDFNINSSIVLDKNKYKLDGYNFASWKAYKIVNNVKKYYKLNWSETNFEKASVIKDGTDLKKEITCSDCLKGGDTIYLQANWVELKGQDGYYTIVFKSNGGSGSMPNQKIEQASGNWGSTNLKGNTFTRTGYKFDGWKAYRIVNGTKKYFVVNKGWVGKSSSNATTIGNKVDIQKNYSKDSIYKTYDIDKYTSSGKYIYLEAQWKVDSSRWLIEVDRNSGTLKSGKSSSFTLTKSGSLPSCSSYISRGGYTCLGWHLYRKDMNGGRITYYTGSTGWKTDSSKAAYFTNATNLRPIYENNTPYGITLYIKPYWKKDSSATSTKKWTMAINRNDGAKKSGSADAISVTETSALPNCSTYATRSGYTCTGWKLYRDTRKGSKYFVNKKGWAGTSSEGTSFSSGASLSTIKNNTGDGATFYAQIQWKKNSSANAGSYKVTFALHRSCEQNMSLRNEPTTYTGGYKIPSANATYRHSNTKFKHWIIQRTSDGRYRVYSNKLGKYTWYKSGDSDIGNWSYAVFTPGETTSAYNAPLKLYAVCGSSTTAQTTTKKTKSWTAYILKDKGKLKKNKSSYITLNSNTTLPKCNDYLERSGYTCNGWKLYRDTRQGAKYFVNDKGWTGNSSKATSFRNGQSLSSIYNYTDNGASIYLSPIWYKN